MAALCTFEALYTPHALRASVSVLPGLIFSFYGHLDLKKDWFFDIWALFTRKMKSETVIFAPNGLNMHFWVVSHPTGTSGKCFRASWPYFELLTPSRLENRSIFRYLGTFWVPKYRFLDFRGYFRYFLGIYERGNLLWIHPTILGQHRQLFFSPLAPLQPSLGDF